jgi:predicted PurR-regulated permease PerM
MLGIDFRAARVTWTVFLFALLLWITYLVRESILIFVAALFVAYVLSPLVDFLHSRAKGKISRTLALVVVFILIFGLVGVSSVYLGSRAIEEGTHLAEQLPGLIRKHQDLSALPVPELLEPYKARIIETLRTQADSSAERILPLLQRALGGVVGVLGSLGFVILVPILTFLFLKDAEQIRNSILDWVPDRHRKLADEITQDVHVLLGQYIRALVILSVLTSVIYLLFFQSVGLPYAVLLSAIAAPLEFIPFIGPLLGTVVILLVALFTGYAHFWWIVIFFIVYRLFQDYALQPYLMSQGIELHPLVVLFGALAGQQLGGLWGMFLSVPVLATLRIVLVRVQKQQRQRDLIQSAQ